MQGFLGFFLHWLQVVINIMLCQTSRLQEDENKYASSFLNQNTLVLGFQSKKFHLHDFNAAVANVVKDAAHACNTYIILTCGDLIDPTINDDVIKESFDEAFTSIIAIKSKYAPINFLVKTEYLDGVRNAKVTTHSFEECGLVWVKRNVLGIEGVVGQVFGLECSAEKCQISETDIKNIFLPISRPGMLKLQLEPLENITLMYQRDETEPAPIVIDVDNIEGDVDDYIELSQIKIEDRARVLSQAKYVLLAETANSSKGHSTLLENFSNMISDLARQNGTSEAVVIDALEDMVVHKLYPDHFDLKFLTANKFICNMKIKADFLHHPAAHNKKWHNFSLVL